MDWVSLIPAAVVGAVSVGAVIRLQLKVRSTLLMLAERAERTRLGKAEIELAELRELYGELLESHKRLRSRISRRAENADRAEQRNNEIPDWRADPVAARRALEAKHGIPSLG